MSQLKARLDRLEARIQTLVEGSVARLFPGGWFWHELARRLAAAMQSSLQATPDHQMTAPNLFFLQVHPDQAQILQANPNLLEGLTDIIMDTGLETGLNFSRRPVVRVLPDPQLQPGMIQVVAQNLREDLSHTATVDVIYPEATAQAFPDRAFLIVNGTRFFSLDQAIINIGRHADNQLVIDDVRISRRHAQLRAVRGRFMLFDLDSAGGTWVNGQLVNQSLLAPGDVISLAGVPLVFGQETQLPDETVDYRPL